MNSSNQPSTWHHQSSLSREKSRPQGSCMWLRWKSYFRHERDSSAPFPVTVKLFVSQPCPTLCVPMNCSPPGSSSYGIFQARILKYFRNTEILKGCHLLLQGIFPNPGMEPQSPTLQAGSLRSEPPGKPLIYRSSPYL